MELKLEIEYTVQCALYLSEPLRLGWYDTSPGADPPARTVFILLECIIVEFTKFPEGLFLEVLQKKTTLSSTQFSFSRYDKILIKTLFAYFTNKNISDVGLLFVGRTESPGSCYIKHLLFEHTNIQT